MATVSVTTDSVIRFFTRGTPRPKGSPKPIRNQHTGKVSLVIDSDAARDFGQAIAWDASKALGSLSKPLFPSGRPVTVSIDFVFQWRKSDLFEKGPKAGQPKPKAPIYHTVYPDVDKLLRTALDALKHGGVYYDDSQVRLGPCEKRYGHEPGAHITITPVTSATTIGDLEAHLFAARPELQDDDEEGFG